MESLIEALTGDLGVVFGAVAVLLLLLQMYFKMREIASYLGSIAHRLRAIDNQLKGIKEPVVLPVDAVVLLVDDSVVIRKVIELSFKDTSCRLICASDGEAATNFLKKESFDMIIADVHLPERNGYEVCEYAKRLYPGIPVLLLVGAFEKFNEELYRSCGADEVLRKPFDSAELVRVTGRLLERREEDRRGGDLPKGSR